MKILLVNPAVPRMMEVKDFYIPSSLLYLGATLQQTGEEVKILDLNVFKPWEAEPDNQELLSETILADQVADFKPALVGIGCLFSGHIPMVLRFAEMLKARFPAVRIVIGGIHPTLYAREILEHCAAIDWVVIGEGEQALAQLVRGLKAEQEDYDQIDGFAYRRRGQVCVNPKTTFCAELDGIPFPALELIRLEDYYLDTSHWHNPRRLPIHVSMPIISSRACPMSCSFCSMFSVMGRKWRARSARNVVDEMERSYQTYGSRHFSFFDDQLTLNKTRIIELANEIVRRNLYLQIESQNGVMVKSLDKEVLDALTTAGLVRMALAIESGSDYIRNEVMGKKLPREKIYEVAQLTKAYPQLYVKAFFIMGMPEDTQATLTDTYNMIREIEVDQPQVFNLLPFPGTRVFDQALRDRLLVDDLDEANLWRFDGFFGSGNKRFFIKPYQLTVEELGEWRSQLDNLIETLTAKKANRERERS
jgi:anaerobic magnesium-protoporphyrin IX monomethyl ester cyclase